MKQKSFFLLAMLLVAFASNAQTGKDLDLNDDGAVDLSDVSILINYILNPPEPEPEPEPFGNQTFIVNGVSFEMIAVEGGTFTMGATPEQGKYPDSDESPTHQVMLSSYMIGKTEVTQELWLAVTGKSLRQIASERINSDTYGVGPNYPMYYVSWEGCQEFITKLNALTGKNFRLPTEAEWEFAARGGNKSRGYLYSGSNALSNVAWQAGSSIEKTQPVATKAPNELGIYDMSGNMLEWCNDWYSYYTSASQTNPTGPASGSGRVCRGGCWRSLGSSCRVSYREKNSPTTSSYRIGLRLAL